MDIVTLSYIEVCEPKHTHKKKEIPDSLQISYFGRYFVDIADFDDLF